MTRTATITEGHSQQRVASLVRVFWMLLVAMLLVSVSAISRAESRFVHYAEPEVGAVVHAPHEGCTLGDTLQAIAVDKYEDAGDQHPSSTVELSLIVAPPAIIPVAVVPVGVPTQHASTPFRPPIV